MEGELACVLALRARLASGYHRDFQMMKEPLFRTVARAQEALEMLRLGIEGIRPDPARCSAALGGDLLATGAALSLAASGTPFREAYRTVAASLALAAGPSERHRDPVLPEPGPTPGAAGLMRAQVQTGLAHLTGRLRAARRWALREERRFSRAMARLAGGGTSPPVGSRGASPGAREPRSRKAAPPHSRDHQRAPDRDAAESREGAFR